MELLKIRKWIRQLINDQQKTDGHVVEQYDSDNRFLIPVDFPDETSIKVLKNGTELAESEWSYNSDTNVVTIEPTISGTDLVKGDDIEITFNYYAKYSDNELDGYIEGALLYFTEFRYKKIFEISGTTIVAENELDPTTSEGHLIALVTAIHINPDNITLRTPDITKTGSQNKSKKDQISETITRWQRTLGTIQFLED